MNDAGLNCLMWDPMSPDVIEGLKSYSILYRKCTGDGTWRYDVMDGKENSATVTIEGASLRDDPLKGLFEVDLKLDTWGAEIKAVNLGGKCYIKRI